MFSPESCIQKLIPHVSVWIWRHLVTILNTGKFYLQVSSLHNSGAFFFLSLCSLAGCPECPCTPPTPKPADACRDRCHWWEKTAALFPTSSHHPPTLFTNLPLPRPRLGRGRTSFTISSAEMQNHFCDSFSIVMKGD